MREGTDGMREETDNMREETDGMREETDGMRESGYKLKETDMLPIKPPKQVARITICGSFHLDIFDNIEFVRPTEEQIKNLHDMLCIDVKLF